MREKKYRTDKYRTDKYGTDSSTGREAGYGTKRKPAGRPGSRPGRTALRQKRLGRTLLSAISSKNYTPMTGSDLAKLLEIPKVAKKDMFLALDDLVAEGRITKDEQGRYAKRSAATEAAGEVYGAQKAGTGTEHGRDPYGRENHGKDAHQKPEKRALTASEALELENDPGADLTEILMEYGVPLEFPAKVLENADRCPDRVSDADRAGRLDLRNHLVITIDGDDSKDFDDAVSLEKDGSNYILGVHIADVTHYVPAGSALDKEALRRGTSVYIPDRVIPMLPEKLSNGICSLNEGEDRLTLSCIVKIDRNGKILGKKITESVICSSHRMTYSKVDRIFERDLELLSEYADIVPMLFDMKALAEVLKDKRRARGMIDFDFPETVFTLGPDRRPVKITPKYPTAATGMIEQFMLTANEVIAETYFGKQVPFLYRTHESPDDEKIETALTAVREFGIEAEKRGQHITPKEVQRIIAAAAGTPKEKMISSMLLRSMQQARYGTENKGHFGLAAGYYCHFTSPIRRYPDLQIHRIIKDDLHGQLTGRKIGWYRKILDDVAWKSSALERRAVEVEREADKVKMAEYVEDHPDEVSDAVVTGVTDWGIYVQRPDTVEGLVHISKLPGDYYEYDEQKMRLVGRHTGKVFEMGDAVRVRTSGADVRRRTIDFELVKPEEE